MVLFLDYITLYTAKIQKCYELGTYKKDKRIKQAPGTLFFYQFVLKILFLT